MYFQYDESAIEYLKQKDKRLADVIDKIGKIEREGPPTVLWNDI